MTAASVTTGTRAERTRAEILAVAEDLFAERGFTGTHLKDVAEIVGIQRPSIVYHFRDKQELYDAVLTNVIGGLMARIQKAITAATSLPESLESAVDVWVDYVGERPTLARILLREIADAKPGKPSAFVQHALPVLAIMEQAIREGQRRKLFLSIDPIHLASTVTGATVFFLLGTPLLGDEWPFDPRSAEQLATLREDLRRVTRRLLGLTGPSRTKTGRRIGQRRPHR